jgi:hypothetical protein
MRGGTVRRDLEWKQQANKTVIKARPAAWPEQALATAHDSSVICAAPPQGPP